MKSKAFQIFLAPAPVVYFMIKLSHFDVILISPFIKNLIKVRSNPIILKENPAFSCCKIGLPKGALAWVWKSGRIWQFQRSRPKIPGVVKWYKEYLMQK
jgi:hypothetical protein